MKPRTILIATGAAGALTLALVVSALVGGESAPAPSTAQPSENKTARRGGTRPSAAFEAHEATSGDVEAAKAAWLREHFGADLNPEPAQPLPAPVQAQAMNDLPPEGSPERFELEMKRTVELFPDTKEFVDTMKEDIAVARHNNGIPTPVPSPAR